MLAESILWFSTGQFDKFNDRLKRSYGIAKATTYVEATATCSAWLALSAMNDRRYDEMVGYLQEALSLAAQDDHQARARACLVLADSFHLAGKFSLARPWYEKTRQHATAEGDQSTLSAMLHNVAAFRASNVKLADALGTHLQEEARRANLEATSAASFDRGIGTKSFAQLLPHMVAQLLIVERKYREAFNQLSGMNVSALPHWGHAAHYADFAFCAWRLGESSLVEQHVPKALAALDGPIDPDDAAYVCCRLASILASSNNLELVGNLRARAATEVAKYKAFQTTLEGSLLQLTKKLETTGAQ
jgi:hypothetical protein